MEISERALDDPTAAPCGKCNELHGENRSEIRRPQELSGGGQFLRSDTLILDPRLKWPKAGRRRDLKSWPQPSSFSHGEAEIYDTQTIVRGGRPPLCVMAMPAGAEAVAHGKYEVGSFSEP